MGRVKFAWQLKFLTDLMHPVTKVGRRYLKNDLFEMPPIVRMNSPLIAMTWR